jgi:tight adherence protein C
VTSPVVAAVLGATAAVAVLGVAASNPARAVRVPVPPAPTSATPVAAGSVLGNACRTLCIALLALTAGTVAPPLVVVPPAAVWVRHRTRALRRERELQRGIAKGLPDAVDLLLLCTEAGWSLPIAHPEVAVRVPPPLGDALAAAAAAADGGLPRSDALVAALSPLGDRARALGHVLADHLHYGVSLAPGLERLGLELRLDRRRRAELDARRVPVRLLGPLVTCILPAFALLTVVPLLAASLRALPT